MTYRIALTLLFFVASSLAAQAGPWLREEGRTFLSFSSSLIGPPDTFEDDVEVYHSFYLEHGVQPNLTFGVDVGSAEWGSFTAIGFFKLPVPIDSETDKFSVRFGVGLAAGDVADQLVVAGASWGRELSTPWGSGWAVLDAQAQFLAAQGDVIAKVDATVGVNASDRIKLIMQVQSGDYPGGKPYVRMVPSVVWTYAPRRQLEIGAQLGVIGDDRVGLKLGSWAQF